MIDLNQPNTWLITSHTQPGVSHHVRRYPFVRPVSDAWVCTCKGYYYRAPKHLHYECRHIRTIKQALLDQFTTQLDGVGATVAA